MNGAASPGCRCSWGQKKREKENLGGKGERGVMMRSVGEGRKAIKLGKRSIKRRQINGSGEDEYCVDRKTARNQNLFFPLTQTQGVTMGTFLHCSDCTLSGVKKQAKLASAGELNLLWNC